MKKKGHAVRYPPGESGIIGKFYNHILDEGHVDSKLLGKVFDSCPTLGDKMNFMNTLLLCPPGVQQEEWIEAFGLSWIWTGRLYTDCFDGSVFTKANGDEGYFVCECCDSDIDGEASTDTPPG